MLISTESFVGCDADADEQYRELRELALQVGDLRSFGIATADASCRIPSTKLAFLRPLLARELEGMLRSMDWDAVPRSTSC